MSPEPWRISLLSGILLRPAVWPQQIWAENWGGVVPFFGGELGIYFKDFPRTARLAYNIGVNLPVHVNCNLNGTTEL